MSSAFCDGSQTDGFKKTFESSMGLLHVVDKVHDVKHMPSCLRITPGAGTTADSHLPNFEIVDKSSSTGPIDASHPHVGRPTGPIDASHIHVGRPTGPIDASHIHVGHPTGPIDASHIHVGHPTAAIDASHIHVGHPTAAIDASHIHVGHPTAAIDASHFNVGHFAAHDPTGMSIVSQFLKLILDMFSAIPGQAEQLVLSQAQDVAGYVAALDKLKLMQ